MTTLPNILRQYNPDLYGYSTGETPIVHFLNMPNTRLNVAMSGAYTSDMLNQAQELVSKVEESQKGDDWKVVTIYIGSNDACDFCTAAGRERGLGGPRTWAQNVADALDYLQDHLRRAFVNLVQLADIDQVLGYASTNSTEWPTCIGFQEFVCPCGPFGPHPAENFNQMVMEYREGLSAVIQSGRYSDAPLIIRTPWFQAAPIFAR